MAIRFPRVAAAICALASGPALAAPAAAPPDARYILTSGSWRFERFGDDVAILRASLVAAATGRSGLFVLSCDGAERRVRIVFPEPVGAGPFRRMLIRPFGAPKPGDLPIVARFEVEQERVLLLSETGAGAGGVVLRLAQLLRRAPSALDVLMHDGPGAITLPSVSSHLFSLGGGAHDAIAFDSFVFACAPPGR